MTIIQIPKNSLQDLLKELGEPTKFSFFCAKCGKPMSLLKGSLVQPILSEAAREGFNNYLGIARNWLEKIALLYRNHNFGVEDRPFFSDDLTKEEDAKMIGGMPLIYYRTDELDQSRSLTIGPDEKGLLNKPVLSKAEIESIRQGRYGSNTAEQRRILLELRDLDNNFVNSLKKLPLLKDFEQRLKDEETKGEDLICAVKTLLHPLDTVKNLGLLANLIFDQDAVILWVNNTKEELSSNDNQSKLTTYFQDKGFIPKKIDILWKYLTIFEGCLYSLSNDQNNEGYEWSGEQLNDLEQELQKIYKPEVEQEDNLNIETIVKKLFNQLERSIFLLVILFGHEPKATQDEFHKIFYSTLNDAATENEQGKIDFAYQFSEFTKISFKRYAEIMTSPQIIYYDTLSNVIDETDKQSLIDRADDLKEIAEILERCKQNNHKPTPQELEKIRVKYNEGNIAELLEKTLNFACTGQPTTLIQAQGEEKKQSQGEEKKQLEHRDINDDSSSKINITEICGWYPKKYPTISVTFLGTPGSGKSSAFISALATFITHCKYKGIKFETVNARDKIQETQIKAIFDERGKPKRTARDERHALEIKVSPESEDKKLKSQSLYFVFIDIPGETAIKGTEKSNWDPAVVQLLASAPILVFFFDLSCDPDFQNKITLGRHKEQFQSMIDDQEENERVRTKKLASKRQIDFIDKMLGKREELQVSFGEQGCMLYIPKIDYFFDTTISQTTLNTVNQGKIENQLKTEAENFNAGNQHKSALFFHSFFETMIQEGILQPRKYGVKNDSIDYVSTGGILRNKETVSIEDQIATMDKISTEGEISLKKMGDAIGEPEWYVTEAKISINSMLSRLKSSFSKFWVLPFSARGGNDQQLQNIQEAIPQKLSEYGFLGPIAMAFDALKEEPTPNPQGEEPTPNPNTHRQPEQPVNYAKYPKANVDEDTKKRLASLRQQLLIALKEGNRDQFQEFCKKNGHIQQEFDWVYKNLLTEQEQRKANKLLFTNQN